MPRTTKMHHAQLQQSSQEDSSKHEESSSEQEHDQEVFLQQSQAQLIPNMKVLRWIGLLMMVYTIVSWSVIWNMRIF